MIVLAIMLERSFEEYYTCPSIDDYQDGFDGFKKHAYSSYYDSRQFLDKNTLGNELSCFCKYVDENREDLDLSTLTLDD